MKYAAAARRLRAYRKRIGAIRARMRTIQRGIERRRSRTIDSPQPPGPRRLSELFGRHRDLFVIHNMGSSCPYCTLWADGFNGLYPHLLSRAAFVVASPDSPAVQQRFARGRRWRFPMVSHAGTTFAADMGYRTRTGWRPAIWAFQRARGGIVRVSDASMSSGDDFCAVWHMLDLLPEGPAGWQPKLRYR